MCSKIQLELMLCEVERREVDNLFVCGPDLARMPSIINMILLSIRRICEGILQRFKSILTEY